MELLLLPTEKKTKMELRHFLKTANRIECHFYASVQRILSKFDLLHVAILCFFLNIQHSIQYLDLFKRQDYHKQLHRYEKIFWSYFTVRIQFLSNLSCHGRRNGYPKNKEIGT